MENNIEITQHMLIATALRMRPDRMLLGECHGAEALDILSAMSIGHCGVMTTINANSSTECLVRLETGVLMTSTNIHIEAARHLIAGTWAVLVHANRLEDGTRRITEISEITGIDNGAVTTSGIFHIEREGRDARGFIRCHHVGSGQSPKFLTRIKRACIPFKLEWLR